jgi:hypothetical protein
MTYPVFATGDVLNASDMNGVGLWLVKSQTVGSGVSSVAVTGAFSAAYDNYLITLQGGSMSVDTALKLQLGSTTSGYFGAFIHTPNYAGGTAQSAGDNNSSSFTYGGASNVSNAQMAVYLAGPNKATRTFLTSSQISYSTVFGTYTGVEASSTQHTGFTLIPFSGTMTGGTIRVYGYRN